MAVSFTDGVKPHLAVMRSDYSDVPHFALVQHTSWWGSIYGNALFWHDAVKCEQEHF